MVVPPMQKEMRMKKAKRRTKKNLPPLLANRQHQLPIVYK
jgi:hypothetical protein